MTERDFCLWLNGFAELTGTTQPTEAQWKMIVEHLGLIFNKVTPPLGKPFPVIGPSPVPQLPVQPLPSPVSPRPNPFGKPAWMTQQDGTPWPPGTVIC